VMGVTGDFDTGGAADSAAFVGQLRLMLRGVKGN
jgi:hypothetical protein